MISLDKKTLLDGVTASGAGSAVGAERNKGYTFVISTTVSGTATIAIQGYIGGGWRTIHSEDVTTDGDVMIRDDEQIRANVTAYTSGTHSVYATGTVASL
jgi:hypothetical protein